MILTQDREIKSLIKASEKFKCNNLMILTKDNEKEIGSKNKKIKFFLFGGGC